MATFARDLAEFRERRAEQKEANLRALCQPSRSLHRGTYSGSTTGEAVEKQEPVRSLEYRRLVAQLACKHCGVLGLSQAAHPNTGKGAAIKASDLECFPLCADTPGRRGCHSKFDASALFSKDVRRAIEPAWSADTRRAIKAAGNWPANLPEWSEA